MSILGFGVGALTAMLTFCSLIGYAMVYTLWLKRATPQNIVIGGAAGAAPPVLGRVALTGNVDAHSLLLFLPNCWRNSVELSVGRSIRSVSTAGILTPSLKRSIKKTTLTRRTARSLNAATRTAMGVSNQIAMAVTPAA
jgi:hypothetical protein